MGHPGSGFGKIKVKNKTKINGSGQGCPLYIWVDSGWRPDTAGPPDSRGGCPYMGRVKSRFFASLRMKTLGARNDNVRDSE